MYITENNITTSADGEFVQIRLDNGDRPWTGGINGKFYRISRGIPVKVPVALANLISQNEEVAVLSEQNLAQYMTPEGKFLGGGRK